MAAIFLGFFFAGLFARHVSGLSVPQHWMKSLANICSFVEWWSLFLFALTVFSFIAQPRPVIWISGSNQQHCLVALPIEISNSKRLMTLFRMICCLIASERTFNSISSRCGAQPLATLYTSLKKMSPLPPIQCQHQLTPNRSHPWNPLEYLVCNFWWRYFSSFSHPEWWFGNQPSDSTQVWFFPRPFRALDRIAADGSNIIDMRQSFQRRRHFNPGSWSRWLFTSNPVRVD